MVDYNILFGQVPAANPQAAMQGALQNQSAFNQFQQPAQNALLQAQVEGTNLQNQTAQQRLTQDQARFQVQDLASDWGSIKPLLQSKDMTNANVAIANRIQKILARGGDPSDTMELRDRINSGQITPEQAIAEVDGALAGAQQAGLLGPGAQGTAYRDFQAMTAGLSPEEREKARRIELGLSPRAMGSAAMTIAEQGKTEDVAGSQAIIKGAEAGAAEGAKLGQQAALMPSIRKSIKLAESEATAKGETFTELSRAKAAMPGLVEVSDKLKALADVATYTTTGKAFDVMSKELGFGSTKGADARTAMVSIVDNQVLPLLRDTFGAAFTAAEGDRLRATLLDPDMAPGQKKASLDAFVEQKYRNMETKERELGLPVTPRPGGQQQKQGGQLMIDANGNRAMVYPDGSFEEMP
jgi:hypothetical protein